MSIAPTLLDTHLRLSPTTWRCRVQLLRPTWTIKPKDLKVVQKSLEALAEARLPSPFIVTLSLSLKQHGCSWRSQNALRRQVFPLGLMPWIRDETLGSLPSLQLLHHPQPTLVSLPLPIKLNPKASSQAACPPVHNPCLDVSKSLFKVQAWACLSLTFCWLVCFSC